MKSQTRYSIISGAVIIGLLVYAAYLLYNNIDVIIAYKDDSRYTHTVPISVFPNATIGPASEITPAVSHKLPPKPTAAPVAPVVKADQSNPYPDVREQILTAINDIRAEKGLLPLKRSSRLDASAQNKADAMVRLDFFAHNDPDGSEPWHYFLEQGYTYYYAGENLSKDYTPGDAIKAWISSPTHYANIVDPHYTETGIVVEGHYIVEHFGEPK